MRNRATAASTSTPPPESALFSKPTPDRKRTKHDELVDVLADGLFEVMVDPGAAASAPRKRRRSNRHERPTT
jgi:hypothetical protein